MNTDHTQMNTPKSAEKLRAFISKEYLNNPEMGSPNWSAAIRDLMTDVLHLGDSFDVDVVQRLQSAHEVYEQEALNELSAKTGVTD